MPDNDDTREESPKRKKKADGESAPRAAAKRPAKKAASATGATGARAAKSGATAKKSASGGGGGRAKKSADGGGDGERGERIVPILSRLRPPEGAVRPKKRLGRGIGSGKGKTAGKGMKGQKARHPGQFSKPAFEGGQTPLQRRLPKYGFHNPFSKDIVTVNVVDLNAFENGATVDVAALRGAGLIRKRHDGVKVLGNGELEKKLVVRVHAYSASAKEKIEKAGGTAEVISA